MTNYRTLAVRAALGVAVQGLVILAGCNTNLGSTAEYQTRTVRVRADDFVHGKPGSLFSETWQQAIHLGPRADLLAQIKVRHNGNGMLEIGNLAIRNYDAHDDGSVYAGWLLNTVFLDLNNDGYLDLIVSGDSICGDDKDWVTESKNVRFVPVMAVFMFDAKTGRFEILYKQDELNKLNIDLNRKTGDDGNS